MRSRMSLALGVLTLLNLSQTALGEQRTITCSGARMDTTVQLQLVTIDFDRGFTGHYRVSHNFLHGQWVPFRLHVAQTKLLRFVSPDGRIEIRPTESTKLEYSLTSRVPGLPSLPRMRCSEAF